MFNKCYNSLDIYVYYVVNKEGIGCNKDNIIYDVYIIIYVLIVLYSMYKSNIIDIDKRWLRYNILG